MAFGFAGAAAGGARALEDIVAERILAQKLEAEIADRQKRFSFEESQQAQRAKEFEIETGQRQQQIDRQAADTRARDNDKGVRRMISESLMQGGTPDRKALAAMQIEAGDAPTMLNEPKPERDPIADHEAKLKLEAKYRPRVTAQPAEKKPLVVTMPDGTIKDLNGVLPPGAVQYDPVAARSSKPANDKEAIDTANEAKRLASALVSHKGFGGAFGLAGSYIPTVRQDTADAEQLLGSLQSMLTMENMGKMKGVLSDSDMKVLRQASTTLSNRMSEGAARDELNRVVEVMGRVGAGDPDNGGGKVMTMAEAQALAAKRGVSVEEVIQRARAKGYTVQ
jgi:hypothetical protein